LRDKTRQMTINLYKLTTPLETRRMQSMMVLQKYPNRIAIIIQKHPNEKHVACFDKNKFLVPLDMQYHHLMAVIRERVCSKISATTAIYLSTEDGTMLSTNDTVSDIYYAHREEEDGLLYLFYTGENTFG
jgi:hypothetical protein